VASVAMTRSIHDSLEFLEKVNLAGGPGYRPFRMYHPFCSHVVITHSVLVPVSLSRLFLGIAVSPIIGDRSPIRAFQSPHTTECTF
jgi:hypothetical protein